MAEHINKYHHGHWFAVLADPGTVDQTWVVGDHGPKDRFFAGPYKTRCVAERACNDLNANQTGFTKPKRVTVKGGGKV